MFRIHSVFIFSLLLFGVAGATGSKLDQPGADQNRSTIVAESESAATAVAEPPNRVWQRATRLKSNQQSSKTIEQPKIDRKIQLQSHRRRSAERTGLLDRLSRSSHSLNKNIYRSYGSLSKGASAITVSLLKPDSTVITEYAVGDTITLSIVATGAVELEFFVDDGDSTFNAGDLFFDVKDDPEAVGDEAIVIEDGDFDDETPAGDGVWQMTFVTDDEGDDAVMFIMQNATIHISAISVDGTETDGVGTFTTNPPVSTTSVSGFVRDDPSTAVANIIVVVYAEGPRGSDGDGPGTLFLSLTDSTGHYTIKVPDDEANQNFGVLAFDYWQFLYGQFPDPLEHRIFLPSGAVEDGWDFEFVPATSTINGTVTDVTGTPVGIPGIEVRVDAGPYSINDTTDADGKYTFPVPAGDWWIRVRARDLIANGYMVPWAEHGVYVDEGSTATMDFKTYAADDSITGMAYDVDELPVEDVEIYGDTHGYYTQTLTALDGTYSLMVSSILDSIEITDEFGHWTQIGYWVGAWKENALIIPNFDKGEDGVRAGATAIDFTVYESDAVFSGHVYDFNTQEPLEGAGLHVYVKNDTVDFSSGSGTDHNGYFEMPLISGFDWFVEVYHPFTGWSPAETDSFFVFPATDIERDYYLEPLMGEGFVEGRVADENGYGIANANVELRAFDGSHFDQTTTDGEGYFKFEMVPAYIEYEVIANVPGFEPQFAQIWVDEFGYWLEFYFSVGGEIRVSVSGTVSAQDGTPIDGALVFAYDDTLGWPVEVAETDFEGYYEMYLEKGVYDLNAGASGYLSLAFDGVPVDTTTEVHFILQEATPEDLTAHAIGSVVDNDGFPISNAVVIFTSDAYTAEIFTGFDGIFEIDLVPATYFAAYFKDGFHDHFEDNIVIATGENIVPEVALMPKPFLELMMVEDVPQDHGHQVRLTWNVNPAIGGQVTHFVIWEMGEGQMPDMFAAGKAPRHVGTVPVHPGFDSYSFVARTLHNEMDTWYLVTAQGYDIWTFWDSNLMAGQSMDNLPPMVPGMPTVSAGASAGEVVVQWAPVTNEPVQYYTVYRSTDGGAFAKVGDAARTEYIDNVSSATSLAYSVTATDYSGNTSDLSAQADFAVVSTTGMAALPDSYGLGANYPNPFNPTTTINYQLPEASDMVMRIYDITGRELRTLVHGNVNAGYHRIVWDGLDNSGTSVPTGVYFYRMTASNFSQTRKMILMK